MIHYRTITIRDPEYAHERELRERVLRRPLGLVLSEEDLAGEDGQLHIVGVDGQGRVIGCVLVAFPEGAAKVRQIAVDEASRGKGVGAELLRRAEEAIRARNIRLATLHARVAARSFFEKLGYTAVSDIFAEVTIPHVRMEKVL